MASSKKIIGVSGILALAVVIGTPFALSAVESAEAPANQIPAQNAQQIAMQKDKALGVSPLRTFNIPTEIAQGLGSIV